MLTKTVRQTDTRRRGAAAAQARHKTAAALASHLAHDDGKAITLSQNGYGYIYIYVCVQRDNNAEKNIYNYVCLWLSVVYAVVLFVKYVLNGKCHCIVCVYVYVLCM